MNKNKILPYNALAFIYDRLMDHVDYKHWASYVSRLIKNDLDRIRSLIDISGGTGEFISNLRLPKTDLFLADLSNAMLTQFKNKPISVKVPVFINDVRKCAIKPHSFDLVLLLYDSFNYLADQTAVQSMLNEMCRILTPQGILIFDAVSAALCQGNFNEDVSEQFTDELGYRRTSRFDQKLNQQHSFFEIIVADQVYYEHHIQYIYSIDMIAACIKNANLHLNFCYDGFTTTNADQYSERMHFVCRKTA